MKVTERELGCSILEALKVDPNRVTGFDLHMDVNEPATIDIRFIDLKPGDTKFVESFRRFQLVPKATWRGRLWSAVYRVVSR